MAESLSTARVDIVVTTEQMDAAIAAGRAKFQAFSQEGQKAFEGMTAAQRRSAESLVKQAALIGKSREEAILYNAAWKGFPTAVLDDIKNKLLQAAAAQKTVNAGQAEFERRLASNFVGGSKAFAGTQKSARELQFALRSLPAQITDIFVSLQAGQNPMNVLLQQGGQLRDIFGGIRPAVAALGQAVLGLINPFTLAAAAIGLVTVAAAKAEGRVEALSKALILSGGDAQATTDQLQAMAAQLDDSTEATAGAASEALAKVAATGQFTTEQYKLVAEAALRLEDATGRSLDTTIAEFARLGKEPVEGIIRLNDAIGDGTNVVRFLTEETVAQIRALEDQGESAKAAELAITAYADAINSRAPDVVSNLGAFSLALRAIKKDSAEIFDGLVNFIGLTDRVRAKILKLSAGLSGFTVQSWVLQRLGEGFQAQADAAALSSGPQNRRRGGSPLFDSAADKARTEAEQKYQRLIREDRTEEIKLEDRIKEIRAVGARAGKKDAELDKAEAAARAAFARKHKGGRGARGLENAEARASLDAIRNELTLEINALDNAKRLLEARFNAGQIDSAQYYRELRQNAEQSTQAQLTAIDQQIAAIQKRALAGKDEVNAEREIADLKAKAAQIQADAATDAELLNIREAESIEDKTEAVREYIRALQLENQSIQDGIDDRLLQLQLGQREYEVRSQINQVLRDQARAQEELNNQLAKGPTGGGIDKEQYDQQLAALNKYYAERLATIRSATTEEAAIRADATNGARRALQDFFAEADDVAQQTYDIFSNAIDGLTQVLTDFFTKGTADWKGFLNNIAAEITAFIIKQQLSKWLQGLFSNSSNSLVSLGDFFGPNAKGNVFAGGQQVQAFAHGGVVNGPTIFPMKRGFGLMGEAGAEAIMPLKRTSDGKLGVEASGAMGGAIYQTINVLPGATRETSEQAARMTGRESARAMSRTGR